ncbi:hypothetical protein X732_25695 [Mesorhizobium sp. L2C066B000]|nr:hypothetical protein X732_25695 [Mesorhizobium sp. L2C066B000]
MTRMADLGPPIPGKTHDLTGKSISMVPGHQPLEFDA